MIKQIELTQEEIDFLISKYDVELEKINIDINTLLSKKTTLLKRKSEISSSDEDIEYNAIVPEPIITKKAIQQDVFGNDYLGSYNTLKKKIGYAFSKYQTELSTGELYNALIELFPSEGAKNKTTFVQSLSKELGQTPTLYKKNENNRDENGKYRFTYLG